MELAQLRSRSTKISDVDQPLETEGGEPAPTKLADLELAAPPANLPPPVYEDPVAAPDGESTSTRAPPLPPLTTLAVTGVIKKGST